MNKYIVLNDLFEPTLVLNILSKYVHSFEQKKHFLKFNRSRFSSVVDI